jgi:hypothetical protein
VTGMSRRCEKSESSVNPRPQMIRFALNRDWLSKSQPCFLVIITLSLKLIDDLYFKDVGKCINTSVICLLNIDSSVSNICNACAEYPIVILRDCHMSCCIILDN